ncbi:putative UTP--glucose-1-phosphate uridylyltransferase [Blattamonas nauphoetae]|uniref:UTP--glucose-1-phosphate uridylyltransferase n=1 Tax=Blattamonas nauphoetae TaxID=2049346 RepID=A0ABQ9YFM6_9EUKA|nr:putative UTP--glucose-1-phosphate uridylyltransferase [Blattamonas nauphoetae]
MQLSNELKRSSQYIRIVEASDRAVRDVDVEEVAQTLSDDELAQEIHILYLYSKANESSVYKTVRALILLSYLFGTVLPTRIQKTHKKMGNTKTNLVVLPSEALPMIRYGKYQEALDLLFETCILSPNVQSQPLTFRDLFERVSFSITSAMSQCCRNLGMGKLGDLVKYCVQSQPGNEWMFEFVETPLEVISKFLSASKDGDEPPLEVQEAMNMYPFRFYSQLLNPSSILEEQTPVRIDITHTIASDIFYLAMDYPEGALVLNMSVDLSTVPGLKSEKEIPTPIPPIVTTLKVIDKPIINLVSVDQNKHAVLETIDDCFYLDNDDLTLLRASLIASGIVPYSLHKSSETSSSDEGTLQFCQTKESLQALLFILTGSRSKGFEITSHVRDIPKGSRLAVSSSLLASLIALSFRATNQTTSVSGPLIESEQRTIAARTILGEWIGGNGGGWQDSACLWPSIKIITGHPASPTDPEFGISDGTLLPTHFCLGEDKIPQSSIDKFFSSLILFHGGLSIDIGKILVQVSEKYLLRLGREWIARQLSISIFPALCQCLHDGDIKQLAGMLHRLFFGALSMVIPAANTAFIQNVNIAMTKRFKDKFWGVWVLGSSSGGGMGLFLDPDERRKKETLTAVQEILQQAKDELSDNLQFAIDPLVYSVALNPHGSVGNLTGPVETGSSNGSQNGFLLPKTTPADPNCPLCSLLSMKTIPTETLCLKVVEQFRETDPTKPSAFCSFCTLLFGRGFDPVAHVQTTILLRKQSSPVIKAMSPPNHLLSQHAIVPPSVSMRRLQNCTITNVEASDVDWYVDEAHSDQALFTSGLDALMGGQVASVTLASRVCSGWTYGSANCIKATFHLCKIGQQFRSFLEIQLSKTARTLSDLASSTGRDRPLKVMHVVTSSYRTETAIENEIAKFNRDQSSQVEGAEMPIVVSTNCWTGLRLIPTKADYLSHFHRNRSPLSTEPDPSFENAPSLSSRHLPSHLWRQLQKEIKWIESCGENNVYRDNSSNQCMHPYGHAYELFSIIANKTLSRMLRENQNLEVLFVHPADNVGAWLDPVLISKHIQSKAAITFEVTERGIHDKGASLARVRRQKVGSNTDPSFDEGSLCLLGEYLLDDEEKGQLSFVSTGAMWVDIDAFLRLCSTNRSEIDTMLDDPEQERVIVDKVQSYLQTIPLRISLKEVRRVKDRFGGEESHLTAQGDRLLTDITIIDDHPDMQFNYVVVDRRRGFLLKERVQLDEWRRNGGVEYMLSHSHFGVADDWFDPDKNAEELKERAGQIQVKEGWIKDILDKTVRSE